MRPKQWLLRLLPNLEQPGHPWPSATPGPARLAAIGLRLPDPVALEPRAVRLAAHWPEGGQNWPPKPGRPWSRAAETGHPS